MIAIVILISLALLFVVYSTRTRKEDAPASRHATPEELAYATRRLRQEEEKRLRQEDARNAVAFQKALEEKFFNSPVTLQIISAISDGAGRLPEEITIYNNRVTGRTNGQMREFDFAVNRVPFLDGLYTMEGEFLKTAHDPRKALACAINRILGEPYDTEKNSIPDHVLLRLKPTNPW